MFKIDNPQYNNGPVPGNCRKNWPKIHGSWAFAADIRNDWRGEHAAYDSLEAFLTQSIWAWKQ